MQEILDHIKARKRAYLDSTDDPELVEAVVYELSKIESIIKQHSV